MKMASNEYFYYDIFCAELSILEGLRLFLYLRQVLIVVCTSM